MSRGLVVRIDPHVHSIDSYDARAPAELLLAQARAVGLDGIVVTDHDAIEESLRAAELAPEFGLIGIPGVELSTADGHLLAIGVEELPEAGRPLVESVAQVRDLGGVAVVPHPFQRSRHGVRRRDLRACDAVEAFNAWSVTGYRNWRARAFAERHGYPTLGASDAHSVAMVGRAYTEITVDDPAATRADDRRRTTGPTSHSFAPSGRSRRRRESAARANGVLPNEVRQGSSEERSESDGEERPVSRADVDGDQLLAAIRNGATDFEGRRTPVARCLAAYAANAGRKTGALLRARFPEWA